MENSIKLNKKILFPFIAYGGQCRGEFSLATSSLFLECYKRKDISLTAIGLFHESLISRARNISAACCLNGDFTHLLFIDSDVYFDTKDVFRLIDLNEDVVAGAYPKKYLSQNKISIISKNKPSLFEQNNWAEYCTDFTSEFTSQSLKQGKEKTKLIDVDYAATGFMLISVNAFKKIINHFPDIKYKNDIDAYKDFGDNFYDFFPAQVNKETKKFESEDYGFCRLWRATGGKVKLIPDITLSHIGSYTYQGNLQNQITAFL